MMTIERPRYYPKSIYPKGRRTDILTKILLHYIIDWPNGYTDRSVADMPDIRPYEPQGYSRNNIASLRGTLVKQGMIVDSGRKLRQNGSKQTVWMLNPDFVDLLDEEIPRNLESQDGLIRWQWEKIEAAF